MTAVCAPRLLIWIPSYNRIDSLTQLLQRFRDIGVPAWAQIVVSDNASFPEYPLDKLRQACVGLEFSYVKNVCNIGACPNILRAFEFASDAPWLLVHSDDDLPSDDFFEILDKSIQESAENVVAIKYDSCIFGFQHDLSIHRFYHYPFSGALEREKYFHNLCFISNWLFRIGPSRDVLRFGFVAAASYVSHLAIVSSLLEISSCSVVRFSSQRPVVYSFCPVAWHEAVTMSSMLLWLQFFHASWGVKTRQFFVQSFVSTWRKSIRLVLLVGLSGELSSIRFRTILLMCFSSFKLLIATLLLFPFLTLAPASLKKRICLRLSISDGGMDRL